MNNKFLKWASGLIFGALTFLPMTANAQSQVLSVAQTPVNVTTDQDGFNVVMIVENASTPICSFSVVDKGRSPNNALNVPVGGAYVFVNFGGGSWKNSTVVGTATAGTGTCSVFVLEGNVDSLALNPYRIKPVVAAPVGSGGGGGGTVLSVLGTANQILSTGGANPVLSLANPIITPGSITVTGTATISGGTLTTDVQTLKVTDTYSNAAQVFNGIEFVTVDTAHFAVSMLLQVFGGVAGTTPEFQLDTSGNVTIPGTSTAAVQQALGGGAGLQEGTQGASNIAKLDVNSYAFMAPTSITTSYIILMPTAAATSPGVFTLGTVSGQIMQGAFSQTPVLGTNNSVAGSITVANNAANAATTWASGATTSNTVNGPATSPANGDLLSSTVPTSNVFTITDSGVVAANVVTAVSPGAGLCHFAGSTQACTSSAVVNADITSMAESKLTGSLGATTITESAASFSITRAGVATANLTAPYVFLNTNSTNSNTSIGLGISTPGTSTGQTTLNVNGAATGGDLTDWGTGGTWAAGVLSGQTILAKVGITGAFTGLSYTANGTTAGFIDLSQGTTSASVSPCNAANSHCIQAGTAVTAGVETDAPALAQGIPTRTGNSSAVTDGYTGDANHSAVVSWSTATTIGSTSLCSSTFCPAGTYKVNVYIDVTTACTTTGSYVVSLIWTDDSTVSKTSVVPLVGLGATPTFGPTAITATLVPTSTTDFGTGSFVLRSTGATSINYSTTAGACATGGPGVGKLYLTVEPIQ